MQTGLNGWDCSFGCTQTAWHTQCPHANRPCKMKMSDSYPKKKNKKRKLRIEVIQSLSDHLLVLWGAHSTKSILCIRITHHMIFSLHTIFTLCLRTLTILSMLYLYRKRGREFRIVNLPSQTKPNPHTIMPKSTSPSGLENIVHWSNWYTLVNAPTHDIHPQCTHLTVGTMCSLHTIHTFEFSLAPFAHRNPCVVHSEQHSTAQYSTSSYVRWIRMYARLGWNSKISAEHEIEMPVLYNPKSNTHTQKLITKDGWASIAMYNIQCAMRINEFKFNGRILPQCIQSSKVAWSRLLYISLKQQPTKIRSYTSCIYIIFLVSTLLIYKTLHTSSPMRYTVFSNRTTKYDQMCTALWVVYLNFVVHCECLYIKNETNLSSFTLQIEIDDFLVEHLER